MDDDFIEIEDKIRKVEDSCIGIIPGCMSITLILQFDNTSVKHIHSVGKVCVIITRTYSK